MIKEAIGIADTVEEAKEKAMAELDVSFDDDFQVEVISLPKKKTLGLFGGSKAQVRVFVEVPDPKPQKAPKAKKAVGKKAQKPIKKDKKTEAADNLTPVVSTKEVPAEEVDANSPAGKGVKYLKTIIDKLGCENIKITVSDIEGGSQITLTGDGLGVVIGHRGETLDALQYLVSLASNAGVGGYYRIVLNTGDFRQKREQTLIALAKRMSEQSIRSGKCRTLEPMNPYERRIIHTTVQGIEGVTSTSFGEGNNRRVVIAPEGKEPRPRNDYRGSRGGRNYNRAPRRREDYKPQANPEKAPVKDADSLPLYGRIDK